MYNRFSIVEFKTSNDRIQMNTKTGNSIFGGFIPHFVQVSKRGRKRRNPFDESQAEMTIKSTELFLNQTEWFNYQALPVSNKKNFRKVSNHVCSNKTNQDPYDNKTKSLSKKVKPNHQTNETFFKPASTSLISNEISKNQPTESNSRYSLMPHLLIGNQINLNENTQLIVALLTTNTSTTNQNFSPFPTEIQSDDSKLIKNDQGTNERRGCGDSVGQRKGRTSISIRELLN